MVLIVNGNVEKDVGSWPVAAFPSFSKSSIYDRSHASEDVENL